jgi:hypothetical protein
VSLIRARAWLVTGSIGRGLAFAIDFGVALWAMLAQRRRRSRGGAEPGPDGAG